MRGYISKQPGAIIHDFESPLRFTEGCPVQSDDKRIERDVVNGTVTTLNWIPYNCGDFNWVFIMHFDLEFKTPWLTRLRSWIGPDVGQVGDHALGLVGYRRKALRQAEVGFNAMWNLFVCRDHYGNWKLRHESDPRCNDKSLPLHGFDTNEFLELNLQHWGWRVITENDGQSNAYRVHNGSGSGRCGDEVNAMIRARSLETLKKYGLQPIK